MLEDFKDWLKDYIQDEQERNGVAYTLYREAMKYQKRIFLTGAIMGAIVFNLVLRWLS